MEIEVQKIPEGLDCNDGPRIYPLSGKGVFEELLKASPDAATQVRQKSAVIQEISPEDLWHAEGEVAVWDCLEDLFTKPLIEFHYSLLMAGGDIVTGSATVILFSPGDGSRSRAEKQQRQRGAKVRSRLLDR